MSLHVSKSEEGHGKGNASNWHDIVQDETQGLGKLKFSTLVDLATGLNWTHFVYLKNEFIILSSSYGKIFRHARYLVFNFLQY